MRGKPVWLSSPTTLQERLRRDHPKRLWTRLITLHEVMNVSGIMPRDGTPLQCVARDDQRGARHQARTSRRNLAFGGSNADPTMMQPCASGGEAPGSGPNLYGGAKAMGACGRRYLGSSSAIRRARQTNAETVCFCYFPHFVGHGIGRRIMPCGTSPVMTNRQSAMSSLRASATIMVLRCLPSATRAWNHCVRALSF